MFPDDLILEWLDFPYTPNSGFDVIEYTENVYIVLRTKVGYRPKYIGWFCVLKYALECEQYDFCCQREGLYLYRLKRDSLPEY
jgi:hypothetical protein